MSNFVVDGCFDKVYTSAINSVEIQTMATDRTWEISDIDGSNKRRVTLAQFLAENAIKAAAAKAIFAAAVKSVREEKAAK